MRHPAACVVALVAAVSLASCSDLVEPTMLTCGTGSPVYLSAVKSRASISGPTGATVASFDTRLYKGSNTEAGLSTAAATFPGPTLVFVPGEVCELKLINDLPVADPPCDTSHSNTLHCADVTNLHTHGLHVTAKVDDVSVKVAPGESHTYRYEMPADHMAGTMWAHAHRHGAVFMQVTGGLASGLLVKQPATSTLPADLAALYGTDGLGGTLAVLQHLYFSGGSIGTDAFAIPDLEQARAMFPAEPPVFEFAGTFASDAYKNWYTVNGQSAPTLAMVANDVTLVRFAHAAQSKVLSLELRGTGASSCEMQLIARDGVFQKTPYPVIRAVAMFTATRADVAIRCGDAAVGSTDLRFAASDTVFLENLVEGSLDGIHIQDTVMSLRVTAGTPTTTSFPTSSAPFSSYLDDVTTAPIARTIEMEFASGDGFSVINNVAFPGFESEDRYLFKGLCLNSVYEVNYLPPPAPGTGGDAGGAGSGAQPPPPAVRSGSIETKTVLQPTTARSLMRGARHAGDGDGSDAAGEETNASVSTTTSSSSRLSTRQAAAPTGAHPAHWHVNHAQIMSVPALALQGGEIARIGEWRDTMGLFAPQGITVRMPIREFTGDVVVHCHLFHEDTGMMGLLETIDCGNSSTTTTETDTTGSSAASRRAPDTATLAVVLALAAIGLVPMMVF